eukprot:SAG31_NODE_6240_length_2107_cov_1.253486_1_plen_121_part_10
MRTGELRIDLVASAGDRPDLHGLEGVHRRPLERHYLPHRHVPQLLLVVLEAELRLDEVKGRRGTAAANAFNSNIAAAGKFNFNFEIKTGGQGRFNLSVVQRWTTEKLNTFNSKIGGRGSAV